MPYVREGQYVVQQDDICSICGEYLLYEDLVMVAESGRVGPMKKDPSFLKFDPDCQSNDGEVLEEAYIDTFHAECMLERAIQNDWGKFSPQQCDACGDYFLQDIPKWAFRFRLGRVDNRTDTFMAESDQSNEAILCPTCFSFLVKDDGEV